MTWFVSCEIVNRRERISRIFVLCLPGQLLLTKHLDIVVIIVEGEIKRS